MSEHIEYHRFRRGEACTYEGCPAKRYYIADGRRFCRLGHEQEGYRQVQQDEDDFNSQGRVTRKKREERERVEKVFRGRQASELYLQCFQLVLWKQVRWLIDVKGLPEEFETVVRDLWAVRLRGVKALGDEGSGSASGGEGTAGGFSSQSEWDGAGTDTEGLESEGESTRRKRKAVRDGGMPKLVDSLGFCYLGILLMRLPVSLGDLHGWAEREEILFLRVVCFFIYVFQGIHTPVMMWMTNADYFLDQRDPKRNESSITS
jgi:RNA polymerase I-specific transcription initiation factor RRN7